MKITIKRLAHLATSTAANYVIMLECFDMLKVKPEWCFGANCAIGDKKHCESECVCVPCAMM
jgi:hypothetical protein